MFSISASRIFAQKFSVAIRYYLFLFIAAASFSACGNADISKEESAQKELPETPASSRFSLLGRQQLVTVLNAYYQLKDALAADDATATTLSAKNLTSATDSFQHIISSDSTYNVTITPLLDSIKKSSDMITAIDDKTCEKQRIPFSTVSTAIYTLAQQSGLANAHIYRQYCPMAFNNKGAYWLSNNKEIKNPYFGAKMLECGEITDTIK